MPSEPVSGVKISSFPTADEINPADLITGIQNTVNKNFTFGSILVWFRKTIENFYVAVSQIGVANGVASLDSSGKVPLSQLNLTNKQDKITASGILNGDGQGGVSSATPGTDYGTYSKPSGGIPSSDMASAVQTSLDKADTAYQKPSGGIPASDIASGVIPTVPSISTSNPNMDGPASPGSTGETSDAGHVHPSDTTKANQTQLAVVETGTTASVAHAVGAYFCWNGLLYRATAAISVGQSFTPGTNCYQTTVTDMAPPRIIGGDLNNYTTPGLYMWTDAAASVPTNAPIVAQSVMIVLQASQAGRVCQIVFAHNATRNGAYYRWLFSNAWTSWYTIG